MSEIYTDEFIEAARTRPCIKCKNVKWQKGDAYGCVAIEVADPDLVNGVSPVYCEKARRASGACGISGRYFEASETQ